MSSERGSGRYVIENGVGVESRFRQSQFVGASEKSCKKGIKALEEGSLTLDQSGDGLLLENPKLHPLIVTKKNDDYSIPGKDSPGVKRII